LRIISWNLLRLIGAGTKEVAALIERHHPDLLLMQEATEELTALPKIVGGYFLREPLHGRIYGLAAWSPHPLPPSYALPLPVSSMPGRVPPRVAQIVQVGDIAFANVHLSHGQFLNRRQLLRIARSLDGPAAIVGDFNAVGPIKLAGFKDVGPRKPTHIASNIISFRLDRCMVRGLRCMGARVLERGPSDHHPIILDLNIVSAAGHRSEQHFSGEAARTRSSSLRVNVESWLRAISQSPDRIRVPKTFTEARNLRKARRKPAQGHHSTRTEDDGILRQIPEDHATPETQ
jgi:endonuclease/exonuclease/phosphatase family metal-dependent hydrolase